VGVIVVGVRAREVSAGYSNPRTCQRGLLCHVSLRVPFFMFFFVQKRLHQSTAIDFSVLVTAKEGYRCDLMEVAAVF
jgi:hypothetical protein